MIPSTQHKIKTISTRLEQLPHQDSPETRMALVKIIRDIVVIRDELIGAQRQGEAGGDGLQNINAVLSSIFGIEYPVSGLQWKRLTEARSALKSLAARS